MMVLVLLLIHTPWAYIAEFSSLSVRVSPIGRNAEIHYIIDNLHSRGFMGYNLTFEYYDDRMELEAIVNGQRTNADLLLQDASKTFRGHISLDDARLASWT